MAAVTAMAMKIAVFWDVTLCSLVCMFTDVPEKRAASYFRAEVEVTYIS
jgi:hypothetical protein